MQVNKGEQHKGEQAFLTSFSFEPPSVCTIPDFQRRLWMDVWVMTMTCSMQPRRLSLPIDNNFEQWD